MISKDITGGQGGMNEDTTAGQKKFMFTYDQDEEECKLELGQMLYQVIEEYAQVFSKIQFTGAIEKTSKRDRIYKS